MFTNKQDNKTSLEKLLYQLQVWAGESSNSVLVEDDADNWQVKTVSIQEVFREGGGKSVARLWLSSSAATAPSLEMILHKYRNKVS